MLFLFPRDVLDELWDMIESVSEGFPTYFYIYLYQMVLLRLNFMITEMVLILIL